MANEIRVTGADGRTINLILWIPVPTPAKDANNNNYVLTPETMFTAAELAPLSQTEKNALNNGTAFMERLTIRAEVGQTDQELLAAAQAKYAAREAYWFVLDPNVGMPHYTYLTQFWSRVGRTFNKA